MRILLAAPNRDLLQCYQKLLAQDFGETVTAFDGAQLLSLLAAGRFDLAILDRLLPRVKHTLLLQQLQRENIPVITLLSEPVRVRHLAEEPLANAFLPYPFRAEELGAAIRSVLEKRRSGELLPFANTALETARFRLRGGSALTAAEIDALRRLLAHEPLEQAESGLVVSALHHKFARSAVSARIPYETGKGFQLVINDE